MTHHNRTLSPCSACASNHGCTDTERRQLLGSAAAVGLLSSFPFLASNAQEGSKSSMLLVDANAEADFKPLRPSDLALGKPLLVFPFDVKAGAPKNETRANKLVVIRLPEDQMEATTRGRSAGGVLAYSALCTHQESLIGEAEFRGYSTLLAWVVSSPKCNIGFIRMKYRFPISLEVK